MNYKELLMPIYKRVKTIKLLYPSYLHLIKYFGIYYMSNEVQAKKRASIILQCHVIEKGLSLKDVRPGFGKEKVQKLLKSFSDYSKKYDDKTLFVFASSILRAYFAFNDKCGTTDADLKSKFIKILESNKLIPLGDNEIGGALHVTKDEIIKNSNIPFLDFLKARHSIRNFTGESVEVSLLKKALEMAKYTPSACNRQPWNVYVFTEKENIEQLLILQTGARQFYQDVGAAIVVCSSAVHFFGHENNQLYLNAGLYSMTLLLALHSLGLGAIPLNLGIADDKLSKIKEFCKIPESVVPVLLIAVGKIPDELNVAASKRFDFLDYTVFDKQ